MLLTQRTQILDIDLQRWTPVRVRVMGCHQCTPSSNSTTLESNMSLRRSVSAFVVVSGFLCHRPRQSFSLCFPGSPSAPRGFSHSRTRREVSGAGGLSVSLHGSLLDRFVVGACTHAPRACARGSCAIHTSGRGHGS